MPGLEKDAGPISLTATRVGEPENSEGRGGPDGTLQLSFLGHRSKISNSLVTHTA